MLGQLDLKKNGHPSDWQASVRYACNGDNGTWGLWLKPSPSYGPHDTEAARQAAITGLDLMEENENLVLQSLPAGFARLAELANIDLPISETVGEGDLTTTAQAHHLGISFTPMAPGFQFLNTHVFGSIVDPLFGANIGFSVTVTERLYASDGAVLCDIDAGVDGPLAFLNFILDADDLLGALPSGAPAVASPAGSLATSSSAS